MRWFNKERREWEWEDDRPETKQFHACNIAVIHVIPGFNFPT